MPEQGWVGFADAVRAIRHDLQCAPADGAGSPVRFEVGPRTRLGGELDINAVE